MKKIESIISPLIENQFPSFYKEEGPQFIAFAKAYYEWLETANNVIYHARRLPDYRDIDTTMDEFIVQFKEKYLKNIQFDTATNKKLLVKNSLDLYRSKGTERSIDLFFKLVYGTSAEVRYPAENILRVSDGIWEKPLYLEVTHSRYNIDYVGKQVIGAISGAKAFVERFIRRRTSAGYIDLLYISGIQGAFRNGEVIGLNINNTPTFDRAKRAQLIGSVNRVIIQDRSRNFKVGDIVTFEGTTNGTGGLARVESVSEASGIVDFIFIDGGYGYTTGTQSIVSEKVLSLESISVNNGGRDYFKLFDKAIEPLISTTFTSASANLAVGDTLFRYSGSGSVSSAGKVISLTQTGANGTIVISHVNGVFTNTATYYTTSNAVSFYANTVQDAAIYGTIMGIPQMYTVSIADQVGTLEVGQDIFYKNTSAVVGYGKIQDVILADSGNTITIEDAHGSFVVGQRLEVSSNSSISANVTNVNLTAGVYNIQKNINTIKYSAANNNLITDSKRIYRYNSVGQKVAEGLLLTVSHDSGSATGNLTFAPISGYFTETEKLYTDANTSVATIVTYSSNVTGGDYTASPYARIFTQTTNSIATLVSTSFGSGAQFNVGTLGDTETIFIGTDLLAANGSKTTDYDRVTLTVASSTGFASGDRAYQTVNKIAFNSNTSVNAISGFFTIPTANSKFIAGEIIRYEVDTGNTALNGLVTDGYYYVSFANASGLILSYPYNTQDQINTFNYSAFANNKVTETGHYFYKLAHGTVFEVTAGVISTKDNHNLFSISGGTVSTTVYANSNIFKYGTSTNTAINATTVYATISQANQAYMPLAISAAAFGFPKNPQGDVKNTIYSCLTFDQFTIGSIGSLSGVDPGSGYNVDPYVLAYQPYISAFGRKDFIISIKDATGVFAIGEKVNQTLANLIYYDLKVDNGAYSNTYNEKNVSIDTKNEIQSSNDFILYTSNSVTFNASDDVNSNTEFIALANAEFFYPSNTYVRYYADASNTVLTGLSNNAFYYVALSNSTGITLKATPTGSNVNITQSANVVSFNSNTAVNGAIDFINIASADTYLANGDQIRYITSTGSTPVIGLSNNTLYYVRYANTSGLALSLTSGGGNVDITALNPGDSGHFIRYYNAAYNGHNLVKYANEFANNQRVLYRVPTSNTVIAGLANNTAYYIVSANTVGFKLSNTIAGANIDITAAGSTETHNFSTVPGFLPGDRLYVNSSPIVNATVQSIYTIGANGYVRISGNTGVLTANVLNSYTNPYVTANIESFVEYQALSTAKGLVKSANTTSVSVKRLTFENTFAANNLLRGDLSGLTANITAVAEDPKLIYPIGLNAVIEANVITANGQVTSFQVVDSGIGYSNGDVIQYTSEDGARSGTIKVVVDGHGIGKGYYRSSKGFISEDMYIHDGDYYQEYSYEILSKISVDRYADMFKKVMHTAGTKFFGSALIVEEDSLPVTLSAISTGQEIQFRSDTNVNNTNETIDTGTNNPFANGDLVRYTTDTGNSALTANYGGFGISANVSGSDFLGRPPIGRSNSTYQYSTVVIDDYVQYLNAGGGDPVGGLTDGNYYYVVFANSTGIKVSATIRGTPITVTGVTPAGFHGFNRRALSNNALYFVVGTTSTTVKLSMFSNGASVINITANGTASAPDTTGHYLTKTIEE
jgi:hypothetical protein